jgi:phosphoribosylanthranilate isomerase
MVRVKICGITSLDDALVAVDAGADALGFVFYGKSPRYIPPQTASRIIIALPPFVQTVGLFVNCESGIVNELADSCGLDLVQLHGDEPPDYCNLIERRVIKALRVRGRDSLEMIGNYKVSGILLDAYAPNAYGGTGKTFNWDIAREVADRFSIILAGGLTSDNVGEAVKSVRPYAVDVSSGVESAPGIKDSDKVREFIFRAKEE